MEVARVISIKAISTIIASVSTRSHTSISTSIEVVETMEMVEAVLAAAKIRMAAAVAGDGCDATLLLSAGVLAMIETIGVLKT